MPLKCTGVLEVSSNLSISNILPFQNSTVEISRESSSETEELGPLKLQGQLGLYIQAMSLKTNKTISQGLHCTSVLRTTEQNLDLELLEMGVWNGKVGCVRLGRNRVRPYINKSKNQTRKQVLSRKH